MKFHDQNLEFVKSGTNNNNPVPDLILPDILPDFAGAAGFALPGLPAGVFDELLRDPRQLIPRRLDVISHTWRGLFRRPVCDAKRHPRLSRGLPLAFEIGAVLRKCA